MVEPGVSSRKYAGELRALRYALHPMPLHCSPLSRRQFIRRSVLGGLAILTWRQGASAAGVDANRWALLSDPHIAADPAAIRAVANAAPVNMTDHLRATVA